MEPLSLQLEKNKKEKEKLENHVEILTIKLLELKSKVKETEEERYELNRETEELRGGEVKLCSVVDGKEESLRRLNYISVAGLLAELGSFRSYRYAKQFIKTAGSNPTESESSTKRKDNTPMRKKGRSGLR